ncbi:Cro/C1-type helix-turn-helix DNA-binding protein [Bacteriovorax stolpii]|uniref:helix-turn-helix domain-containing protein n=1 Tax=Bacteriovorax stolpii TaxID=960 RepID=UPI0010DCC0FC|nr:helix-turn-helix transcriptional regulator [Bacteriovorax stolpii]TDP55602.1 Cro/C1-type helix-turn-helix DNA-binding protein [Bacteriovorax stolpii]
MSQIDQFLNALKRALKAKNIIYKDLAQSLDLSESSVKRILADKSISLERIEEICRACDLSFAEICKNANFEEEISGHTLSKEHEKVLAENPRLLHYFIMLNDGMTPQKIEREFDISANESKKHLLLLDKINLIELHPRDRVKLKNKAGTLRFRRDGAVGRTLFLQTKNNFLNYDFNEEGDYIRFSTNSFGPVSLAKFKKKFDKLVAEIQEESRVVEKDDNEAHDIGILLAMRPWKYPLEAIKKK